MIVIGVLRSDDARASAPEALAAATSIVARSLRGDDWLGRSGRNEFAVLLRGDVRDAEIAATRLTAAIADLDIPGLGACAGVTALEPGSSAAQTLREVTEALQVARSEGAGRVVRSATR
ncbi:diguanylate cyclase domain-containing protein [Geodermatophilus sp. DSM 44513]|uniref:diguanylate cyclase domain-containing protein n=1 Tax=Geodermatophilus sp. DSM 44513 TaxID=1528104 RepID=UPI0028F74D18|nr:diguanylate cyclase [Geodermatophilus sp. DSM 44513]WNV76002.1 diguanylate cyclase [Geodermatophilus sp. DSM 44513]